MGKTETWVSFGTGLAMTAAGLLLDASWLLGLAAICYAVALILWIRERRMTKDGRIERCTIKGPGSTPDAPSVGIVVTDKAVGSNIKNVHVENCDVGIEDSGQSSSISKVSVKGPSQDGPKRRKFFSGFSFSKGDHLE